MGKYIKLFDDFDKVEIDNIDVSPSTLDTSEGKYQLSNGIHTVKYTLKDPTTIGVELFMYCPSLISVIIPDSVTSIGDMAFNECSGLTNVTIPNSVTTIGNTAFANCSGLTSVTIPDNVTSIGEGALQNCGLLSVTIGNGVTSIGEYAFGNCSSLTSVTIGSGVTSIGGDAFYNCSSLTSITSLATTAPTIAANTFGIGKTGGTLYVPIGSSGYDIWMQNANYYLGLYSWTKVEQ